MLHKNNGIEIQNVVSILCRTSLFAILAIMKTTPKIWIYIFFNVLFPEIIIQLILMSIVCWFSHLASKAPFHFLVSKRGLIHNLFTHHTATTCVSYFPMALSIIWGSMEIKIRTRVEKFGVVKKSLFMVV